MNKVNLNDLDFVSAFFHFTHVDSMTGIIKDGLGPRIGDNSNGVEDTEKVFFSKGYEGVLQLCDVWIKWIMNKTYSDINLHGLYDNMPIKKAKILQEQWAKEFISKDYLKDVDKKQYIYKIIFEGMQNRRYLSLEITEGIHYSNIDIDENKVRNNNIKKQGDNVPYLFMKELYGSFSNVDSIIMDKWNMHTFTNQGVESNNISHVVTSNGNEDALSVVIEIYDRYKELFPEVHFDLLDEFIIYSKSKLNGMIILNQDTDLNIKK